MTLKSLEDIARFISERDHLRCHHWQLFDLSAARAMTDEMQRQYSNAGEWQMSTPMPADYCVFWDGVSALFARKDGDQISCSLGEDYLYIETMSEVCGKSKEFLDALNIDPLYKGRLIQKLGKIKTDKIILDAEKRIASHEAEETRETFDADGQPSGPMGRCVAVWSEFISFPIAQHDERKLARPIRRRLQRLGVALEVRTVSLSPANHKAKEEAHSPGARKALHFCRGHWRRSSSSKSMPMPDGNFGVWIAGHWRGDPEKGIVLHNYVASLDDVENRARLIA